MTVALCLSGGGAKGSFELGVIRYLYDHGIRPDVLTSTSVGSINAVKLAEGEDPNHPERGLAGLEALWGALQTNDDMYLQQPWLNDKDMDPRVRDLITGRSTSLGIHGPEDPDGRWGDLDWFARLIGNLSFLGGDGTAVLKSLGVLIRPTTTSVYNLDPIHQQLFSKVDLKAISAWVSEGKKWRMAATALESGLLRYITETGAVVERDGSPVDIPGPLTPECQALADQISSEEAEIASLQEEMSTAGSAKAAVAAQIRQHQATLRKVRVAFQNCVSTRPKIPLVVDIRDGVMASASMPVYFPTVRLGNENYVDGGVREVIPIQAAIDCGATLIYAVSASPLAVESKPPGTYDNALLTDVAERSLVDIALNEIDYDDARAQRAGVTVRLIAPDVEVHNVFVIDPGLIQINKDYGYMRAADVLNTRSPSDEVWQLATQIAQNRVQTWRLENARWGKPDPSTPSQPAPAQPDPTKQPAIDASKKALAQLIASRRAKGGPVPVGIERWATRLELHPWVGATNDATFVSQNVPAAMSTGSPVQAQVVMRNTGGTSWTRAGAYRLGAQAPQDNTTWGTSRVELSADIPPGGEATFAFPVTVPPPGHYQFQWRMVQEGHEWFGQSSPAISVTTAEATACTGLRSQVSQLRVEIKDLQDSKKGLDPRNAADRMELKEIDNKIQDDQRQIGVLSAQMTQLGCTQA